MLNKKLQSTLEEAFEHGFSPIPWIEIDGETMPRKFKGKDYPIDSSAWDDCLPGIFGIRLDSHVLIDLDANKPNSPSIETLQASICSALNIDEFDLECALFQSNVSGDSLHYLFKSPANIDQSLYQHSNDGRFIEFVDFKTSNQLVNIKEGKTVHWQSSTELQELTIEQYELLFAKTSTSESNDDVDFMSYVAAQPDPELTLNDMQVALDKIDVSVLGYDEWFRIGLAISHQTENGDDGKDLFKSFSTRFGDGYDEREIDSKWPTFKDDSRQSRVTFKSVYSMIKDNARESLKKTLNNDSHRATANEIVSQVAHHIKEQVNFDIDICRDTVQTMLAGSFWNASQSKLNMTNNDNDLVIFPESKASEMLVTRFGQPVSNLDELKRHLVDLELSKTDIKHYCSMLMNRVVSAIQFNSQGDSVTYQVDIFTDRTYFNVKNNAVQVNFKYEPLKITGKYSRVECNDSVSAYLKHFPECDDLVEMIVASRFASSRKKAYVWLKCPSDWGKDVFRNALGAFHFEMSVTEVEKAIEGAPVGKSPRSMFRAFAMVTNEFKKVKAELKQLEDDIVVSPKFQLETTVPLYTKLFMSAEGIDSLVGEHGVESQFANRFSMICGSGRMTDIPEFKTFGNTHFVNAVVTYITDKINDEVDCYRNMSKVEATMKGDEIVAQFHSKYGLSLTSKTIDENMGDIVEEIKLELVKFYETESHCENGIMYLKRAKTRVQDIIVNGGLFTHSEKYTILHKTDQIMLQMSADGKGVANRRVNGNQCKCLDVKTDIDVCEFDDDI